MIGIVTLDEFEEILNEIYEDIPKSILRNLNLGIVIEEGSKLHPEDLNNNLYVLGEYKVDMLGRNVKIYYGSFNHIYWYLDRDEMKEKVRETLYHELTHHLEHQANMIDLEIEDKIFIENYKKDHIQEN